MTTAALDTFKTVLDNQLGVSGVFTESAIFDPSGAAVTIYGIFEENSFRGDKGGGNVQQKKDGPRFVVSEIGFTFDVYDDVSLYLPYRDKTFKIQQIDADAQGVQVIWLV